MTREEAIRIIETVFQDEYVYKYYDSITHQALNMAIEALQTIDNCDQCEWCCPSDGTPTIHVVRCKDCINYETCNLRLSHWWKGGYTVDIEFCSFGERREP